MIDLQNHTVASDGELTPEELVDLAIGKKLSAIAITDHDSISSVKKAIEYSKGRNIEIVPGVELSCDDPLFNPEKLKYLGYEIEYEDVKKTVKGTFGRPHIAKYLLKKYPDEFASVRDVFDKLIGHGKKAYFDTKGRVSIKDGIRTIKE